MKHSLAHNAGYNLIYQLLNVLFPLISAGYVARILAPERVGTVTDAQNLVSYFVMFAARQTVVANALISISSLNMVFRPSSLFLCRAISLVP